MNGLAGITGYFNGLFLFELLEKAHEDIFGEFKPGEFGYNILNSLKEVLGEELFFETIAVGLYAEIIQKVRIRTNDKQNPPYQYSDFNLDDAIELDVDTYPGLNSGNYLREVGFFYIVPNIDKIKTYLDQYVKAWLEGEYCIDDRNVNTLIANKQIEKFLNFMEKEKEIGINMRKYLLNFESFYINELSLTACSDYEDEKDYQIDLFMVLWYLQSKGDLKVLFGHSVNKTNKIEYRIDYLGSGAKNGLIENILTRIEGLEELASKSLLELDSLDELCNEINSEDFSFISDTIFQAELKKLKSRKEETRLLGRIRPGDPTVRYVSSIGNKLSEWKRILENYQFAKNNKSSNSNEVKPLFESTSPLLNSQHTTSPNIETNKHTNNISLYYTKNEKCFIKGGLKSNFENEKLFQFLIEKCYESDGYTFCILEEWDNYPILKIEYNKGKIKGKNRGKKWGSMQEFIEGKVKNIRQKVKRDLNLNETDNTKFIVFRDNIMTINIPHK